MRTLLLSDIHANAAALRAVLEHARRFGWDRAVFLGDAVGYYTEPEEVVQTLIELDPEIGIVGNHDELLLGFADGVGENGREGKMVHDILKRHLEALSEDALAYLRSLRDRVVREEEGWEATHGALRAQFEYLTTLQSAQANAPFMKTSLCFFGHTHVPRVFASVAGPNGELWRTVPFRNERAGYRIPPRARVFFNPGSIGQPRDGLPLASYALFDDETRTVEVHRVEYDLVGVQRAVRAAGYPEALANRLAVGK